MGSVVVSGQYPAGVTSDALFGPDGTQLPEPQPVLPDPLVGPGTAGTTDLYGPATPQLPPTRPVPLPSGLDPAAMREAIRAALGDEPTMRQPPQPTQQAPVQQAHSQQGQPQPGQPQHRPQPGQQQAHPQQAQPQQAQPVEPPLDSLRTPPSGIPVPPGYRQLPPAAARGAGPPPQRPGVPLPVQRRAAMQRAREPAHVTDRRSPSGGGWIGCVVLLIFIAIVVYNLISALVDAFTGG
jgi:hypothetical protein